MYNDGVDVVDSQVGFAIESLFGVVVVVDFYGDSWVEYVCDNVAAYFCHHLSIVVAYVVPCRETCVASSAVEVSAIILEQP